MINSSICMDSLILSKRTNVALSSFNKHEVQITKDSLPFSRRLARIGMHITREFSYLQSCSQDSNFLTPSFENKIECNHVVEGNLRIKAIHFKTVLNHYSRHSKLSPNNTSISYINGRYRLQYKPKNLIEKSEPEVLEVQKREKKKFSDLVKKYIPDMHQDTSLCYLSKNDLLFMSTANLGTAAPHYKLRYLMRPRHRSEHHRQHRHADQAPHRQLPRAEADGQVRQFRRHGSIVLQAFVQGPGIQRVLESRDAVSHRVARRLPQACAGSLRKRSNFLPTELLQRVPDIVSD